MKIVFPLHEIMGKKPLVVAKLFRMKGINPNRPYRASVSFNGIVIEQEERPPQ
jgi:hypothetical protein